MANRVAAPNLFAPSPPNWSLAQLDANAQAATGAINDSSLGSVNGPLADSGSVNAYSVTCSLGTPSAYNNGMTVFFNPASTNTGASTLTVAPLASLPIVSATGNALTGGELQANSTVGVVCDGSAFRIISVPAVPYITAVRLRSFNAIGNSTFEVDQANAGAALTNVAANARLADRWFFSKAGTMTVNSQQMAGGVVLPGTNFWITRTFLRITLTAQETTLAATDSLGIYQSVEGPQFRELYNDVHSQSILVRCSVPLKFCLNVRDNAVTQSLTALCTISTANTWTLCQIPNLPVFPSGNFSTGPGTSGQTLRINLAAGSSLTASANNVWQSGNLVGALGQDNFAAQAVNSTFDMAFVQWEPGSVCTTLIDKPFSQNLDECLRYYCKSYPYGTKAPTASVTGLHAMTVASTVTTAALGWTPFPKVMAKTLASVNVPIYANDGTASAVLLVGGANASVSSLGQISDSGFGQINFPSALTANQQVQFHYAADTGW